MAAMICVNDMSMFRLLARSPEQFLQAEPLLPVLWQLVGRCLQATETLFEYRPVVAGSNYVETDAGIEIELVSGFLTQPGPSLRRIEDFWQKFKENTDAADAIDVGFTARKD